METFNKLVRDKIPDIIAKNGEKAIIRKLENDEYTKALNTKLQEEVKEYLADESVQELADIIEVIYALLDSKGVTLAEFEKTRKLKVEKRGAFKEKIFLEATIKKEEV